MKPYYFLVLMLLFLIPQSYALDTGALSPNTIVDNASVGTVAWSNPTFANSSDSIFTTSTNAGTSHYLIATNFSFSIPTNSTINGIMVEVFDKGSYVSGDFSTLDNSAKIVKGGVIGSTEMKRSTQWTSSGSWKTYGNSSYLWGEMWNATQINAVDFGFAISALASGAGAVPASVDHIRITVYYDYNITSNVSACGLATTSGTYTLNQSISSSGTCITIGANNVTLDGAGYTINYSQSAVGYGINNTGGYNFTTIKNANIVNGNSTVLNVYAIYFTGASNGTIQNNTLISNGSNNHPMRIISSSSYNTIFNNNITTFGSASNGIYLSTNSNSNNISNNIITTFGGSSTATILYTSFNTFSNNIISTSSTSAKGIDVGASNNLISNNTITTAMSSSTGIDTQGQSNLSIINNTITSGGIGLNLWVSYFNNISGGSIISTVSKNEYSLYSSSTTNNFINTNFTVQRNIKFVDTTSWFNYNNETNGNIWLKTSVSPAGSLNRTLITWSNSTMKWNDTASAALTASYNLTGLLPSTSYNMTNGTSSQIVATDSSGSLGVQIALASGVQTTMTLDADLTPPAYTLLALNNTAPKKNEFISFSALWNDLFGLSQYIFSWNITGVWTNTTTAFSGNWSNITAQVTANKTQRIDYIIYANDTSGNTNQTIQGNFTVVNSPPIMTAAIIPSPTDGSADLNCTYTYYDIDNDAESNRWFKWYKNNALLSATTQNLTNSNFTNNDNIICSIRAFDGTDNSTWTNSTTLTINDNIAPVLHSDSLSASSGYTNIVFNSYVNVTETNAMSWVYLEIQDPNQVKSNLTMTQDAHSGSEYSYSVPYTPTIAGTYYFKFYALDGSGNLGNMTSSLNYVASVYVAPSPPSNGGGGGGSSSYNYTIDVYPKTASISKFSLGATSFVIKLKNSGSANAIIRIVGTTGNEYFVGINTTLVQDSAGYFTLTSGAEADITMFMTFDKEGQYLNEWAVQDKNNNDVILFSAVTQVYGGNSLYDKLRKNIQYPIISDPNTEKFSVDKTGIHVRFPATTSLPIGWFIGLILIAVLIPLFNTALFLKAAHLKANKNLSVITSGLAFTITLIIFVFI